MDVIMTEEMICRFEFRANLLSTTFLHLKGDPCKHNVMVGFQGDCQGDAKLYLPKFKQKNQEIENTKVFF